MEGGKGVNYSSITINFAQTNLVDTVNSYLIPEDAGPTMAGIYFAGLGDHYHHQNPVEYKKDIMWSHKSSLYQICGSHGLILGNLIMYLACSHCTQI